MGLMHPQAPDARGWGQGGCSRREGEASRACWVQVSGPAVPSLHFAVVPGPARALKDSPTPSSQCPRGLGPKRSIPKAHVSSFPARTSPRRGPWGRPQEQPPP